MIFLRSFSYHLPFFLTKITYQNSVHNYIPGFLGTGINSYEGTHLACCSWPSTYPSPLKGTRNSWKNKHFQSWHKKGSRGDSYQSKNKEMLKERRQHVKLTPKTSLTISPKIWTSKYIIITLLWLMNKIRIWVHIDLKRLTVS